MLQISCPWCGVRDEDEFSFGGPGDIRRPDDPEHSPDEIWADYLFHRSNPIGMQLECWQHVYGCRQWFFIERDTLTHVIYKTCSFDQYDADDRADEP